MMVSDEKDLVPLAATIRQLRLELWSAVTAAEGEELQFSLGPVELEFQVAVTNEVGGEAGIRFWVVTLGAEGSHARAVTNTVKLTLTPQLAGKPGADVNVSDHGQLGA